MIFFGFNGGVLLVQVSILRSSKVTVSCFKFEKYETFYRCLYPFHADWNTVQYFALYFSHFFMRSVQCFHLCQLLSQPTEAGLSHHLPGHYQILAYRKQSPAAPQRATHLDVFLQSLDSVSYVVLNVTLSREVVSSTEETTLYSLHP